ncbi:hypothetical protein RIF29_15048 [Crotalaria pallida]|uniref:Uncharacterized protein n=1 Tax=Crotalaria pallida TaxID=3830 RepID=A0AAN9FEI5_CROPI
MQSTVLEERIASIIQAKQSVEMSQQPELEKNTVILEEVEEGEWQIVTPKAASRRRSLNSGPVTKGIVNKLKRLQKDLNCLNRTKYAGILKKVGEKKLCMHQAQNALKVDPRNISLQTEEKEKENEKP